MRQNIKKRLTLIFLALGIGSVAMAEDKKGVDYVNPFIGTANFGTTNPGPVLPNGLMSVSPFNVMGASPENKYDKDARWWSTPYTSENKYFTGFSHVNLSGVGCPELGGFILMPTSGALDIDYKTYGSKLRAEEASPGRYRAQIERYQIETEVTVTQRSAVYKFSYESDEEANLLLNLGQSLSNETGAKVRFINDSTILASRVMGTFCYAPQAVFTQYLVLRLSEKPQESGYWKMQPHKTGVEAEWDPDDGKYKLYKGYKREMMGDDIGVYFRFAPRKGKKLYVQTAVSFTSEEAALKNLEAEQPELNFDNTLLAARKAWEEALGVIEVKGGTEEEKTIFYTALYHLLIHPNILQDVDGSYPEMSSLKTRKAEGDRYTVYSLWDTYRNVHPLLSLLFPEKQEAMVRTMVEMYREQGWMPKWELMGQETYTMEGDPAIVVINDTYQRGLRNFDVETAWEAIKKSTSTKGATNPLRPDNDDYLSLGYVPLREQFDNSVSHALEYYIADWNASQLASSLGYKKEARVFLKRSLGYKRYYDKGYGTLRPLLPDGKFLSPFDPETGKDFEPSPGFHEGTAWNYTFFVPHDIKGLIKLMGGEKAFTKKLQHVFDSGRFDPTNEPDIAYPYLFTYIPREAWRTQKLTREILHKYYHNSPEGIPGNDDTGTMSAWAIYSMMGFYPDCPGKMEYALTTPTFDEVRIKLDPRYFSKKELVIRKETSTKGAELKDAPYFESYRLGDKEVHGRYRVNHFDLVGAGELVFHMEKDHK